MDFAALMSKEISKAKGATDTPSAEQKDQSKPPEKKYARRGEQEAARVAAYNEEQERQRRQREERITQKRKADDEEAERRREREAKKQRLAEESRKKREEQEMIQERERRKKLGLPELPPPSSDAETPEGEKEEEDIPDEELTQKFREFEEPICLFGETHAARLRRCRRLIKRTLAPQQKLSEGPIPTTLELVPEVDMKIPETLPKDDESRQFLFRQLASYFNMVLSEWEIALSRRDLAVKQSMHGRQAYNAMAQSRDNMRPLFRKMEKNDLDDGMLEPILEIVNKAQKRRYVDANDAYLRLSIGKAYVFSPILPFRLKLNKLTDGTVHGPSVSPWLVSTNDPRERNCTMATSRRISSVMRLLANTSRVLSAV